jgi:uncharacterized protein
MKLLTVSDLIIDTLYTDFNREKFLDIDAIISCGDLPYNYLDFLSSKFNSTVYYVRGNHANFEESPNGELQVTRIGGINLHGRSIRFMGRSLAGIEGCIQYNRGSYQYTQTDMWFHVFRLIPQFFLNRLRYGNYVDIFVTHTPPWLINDQQDPAHQGAKAFRWLIKVFKPAYQFHGHVHLYTPELRRESIYHDTRVINTYGYRYMDIL